MIDREKAINDLNVSKRILCNPQMLTPEMCVKIGQAVTNAIDLLKEQEPKRAIIEGSDVAHVGRCPSCHVILTPFRANYCYCCGEAVKW